MNILATLSATVVWGTARFQFCLGKIVTFMYPSRKATVGSGAPQLPQSRTAVMPPLPSISTKLMSDKHFAMVIFFCTDSRVNAPSLTTPLSSIFSPVSSRHNSKSLGQSREIYDEVPHSPCSRSERCFAPESRCVSFCSQRGSEAGPPAKSVDIVRDWSRLPVGREMAVRQSRGTSQTRRIMFLCAPTFARIINPTSFSAPQRRRESASKQRQSFYE
jgi:hypothetical protein